MTIFHRKMMLSCVPFIGLLLPKRYFSIWSDVYKYLQIHDAYIYAVRYGNCMYHYVLQDWSVITAMVCLKMDFTSVHMSLYLEIGSDFQKDSARFLKFGV